MSGPLDRILRRAGVADLVDILSERLSATDLQSLLLEVYRRRAHAGRPGELMTRYAENRFVRPAEVPVAQLLELDRLALSLLPGGFESLDLSPVAPLGTTAIVTGTSQNRIVSTSRNTEVAADSTNAMALECAARRRALLGADAKSSAPVKLAASQRLLRAQPFAGPRSFAHFRLFGLCTAGRDTGSFEFELSQLPEQIGFHVRLLQAWRERGADIARIRVPVTLLEGGPAESLLREQVLEPLASEYPDVDFDVDPAREHGRDYYRSACFKIYVEDASGSEGETSDGGFTDWTGQLVGSRKERLLISGTGSERVAAMA